MKDNELRLLAPFQGRKPPIGRLLQGGGKKGYGNVAPSAQVSSGPCR